MEFDKDLTGKNRLARNAIVSWTSHLVLVISGFIMPRMIDKHIGQTQLGIWDFCWSFVNYLNLLGLGIGASVNRYVAKYRMTNEIEKLTKVVSTVSFIQAILAALVLVGTLLIFILIPVFYKQQLGENLGKTQYVIALLGYSLAIQMFFDSSRGIITGCHRWDIHNSITAAVSFTSMILMVAVLINHGGLVDMAIVYASVVSIFEFLRRFYARKVLPEVKIQFRKANIFDSKRMLKFGGGAIVFRLPPVILVQTVNVLLVNFLGPSVLAVFSRPIALVRHVRVFISKFSYILTPSAGAMQDDREKLKDFLVTTTRLSVAVTLPIITVLVIFGDLLMKLWMGESYADWSLVAILALGYFLPVAQDTIISVLIGMNKHVLIARNLLFTTFFTASIVGVWIFFSGWSTNKAALLVAIPISFSYGLLLPFYASRELKISYLSYLFQVVAKPIIYNIPTILLLLFAREEIVHKHYLYSLILFSLAFIILFITYYVFILPTRAKNKLKKNQRLRNILLYLLVVSGMLSVIRYFDRKKIIIFMLHGVIDNNKKYAWSPLRNSLATEDLDKTLKVLSKYYNFITLDYAVDVLAGKKKPIPNSIVMTFDDGYKNNITQALPILKKYNIVPSIFVATHYISDQIPYWFDRIDYAIQLPECNGANLGILGDEIIINNSNRGHLKKLYKKFRAEVKQRTNESRLLLAALDSKSAELESIANINIKTTYVNDEIVSPLDWGEIKEAHYNKLINFGSHTVDHASMLYIDSEELRRQIVDSKAEIEKMLNSECKYFCYPYGDYNENAVKAVMQAGYQAALTTKVGKNSVGDNLFTLKRFNFPSLANKLEILYYLSSIRDLTRFMYTIIKK